MHVSAGAHRGQQRALDPLELESQPIVSSLMWVLGTETGFSVRAVMLLTAKPSL